MNSSFPSRARAFTLIELLLVIAIIGILVGLLSGPASRALKKARDADWANKTGPKVGQLVAQLKAHYQKNNVTDSLTPIQLAEANIIDRETLRFLQDPRVKYSPFVSSDPDEKIIVQLEIPQSFLGGGYQETVRKDRVTNN